MSTANLNDMATLSTDPVFGNRVLMSVILYCASTIPSEAITGATSQLHLARKQFAATILNNPGNFKQLFINTVAANQIVANDATASGTIVGQTGATLATSALLCTDSDINNAVAAAFNAFIPSVG
jgi:hypothetical protein